MSNKKNDRQPKTIDADPLQQYWNDTHSQYECDQCDKTHKYNKNMVNHLKMHSPEYRLAQKPLSDDPLCEYWNEITCQFECNRCDSKCVNRADLNQHFLSHKKIDQDSKYWNEETQRFDCDQCTKTFEARQHLSAHLTFHKKMVQRTQAKKQQIEEALQLEHSSSAGLDTNNVVHDETLEIMDLDYISKDKYWDDELKLYKCDKCDKTCTHLQHMVQHVKKHRPRNQRTQEELDADPLKQYWNNINCQYECDKCDQTHEYSRPMERHLKRHSYEYRLSRKPLPDNPLYPYWNEIAGQFECNQCDAKYFDPNHMTKHLKSHLPTPPKPVPDDELYWNETTQKYDCNQCDKKCNNRKGILNHIAMHERTRRSELFRQNYWNAVTQRFDCDKCPKSFEKSFHLAGHFNFHKQVATQKSERRLPIRPEYSRDDDKYWNAELQIYECDECSKTCVRRNHLSLHLMRHGKRRLRTQQELEADQLKQYWNDEAAQYECDQCDKTTNYKKDMTYHLKKHNNSTDRSTTKTTGQFPCNQCDKVCLSSAHLAKHLNVHQRVSEAPLPDDRLYQYWNATTMEYECTQCYKSFLYASHMSSHLNFHTIRTRKMAFQQKYWNADLNRFQCDKCTSSYARRDNLSRHIKQHLNIDKHKIAKRRQQRLRQSTDQSAAQRTPQIVAAAYNRSEDKYWNAELKIYQCDECDKTCIIRQHMTMHLMKHGKRRRRTQKELDADPLREYWNEDQMRYECDQCDKSYVSSCHITNHLKQHSKNNQPPLPDDPLHQFWNAATSQYDCNQCDTKCVDRNHLSKHLKVHKRIVERPLPDDAFHQYWHESTGQFECNRCDKKCFNRIAMKKHIYAHENTTQYVFAEKYWNNVAQRYECDQCTQTFDKKNHLSRHLHYHLQMNKRKEAIKRQTDEKLNFVAISEMPTTTDSDTNHIQTLDDITNRSADKYWNADLSHYECDQCSKTYAQRMHMLNHLEMHQSRKLDEHDDDPFAPLWNEANARYECNQCSKTCAKRNHMSNHMKLHQRTSRAHLLVDSLNANWNSLAGRYECDKCSQTFEKHTEMRNHLKRHDRIEHHRKEALAGHDNVDDKDIGPITGDRSAEIDALWNAIAGRFECKQCDKSFTHTNRMSHHLSGHELFKCKEQLFWQQVENQKLYRLRNDSTKLAHLNKYWHDELKRYKCDQCGKTYLCKKPMDKHIKQHRAESRATRKATAATTHKLDDKQCDQTADAAEFPISEQFNLGAKNDEPNNVLKVLVIHPDANEDADEVDDDFITYDDCSDDDEGDIPIFDSMDVYEMSTFSINCPNCEQDFDDIETLKQHMMDVHGLNSVPEVLEGSARAPTQPPRRPCDMDAIIDVIGD